MSWAGQGYLSDGGTEALLLGQAAEELSASSELHGEVDVGVVLKGPEEPDAELTRHLQQHGLFVVHVPLVAVARDVVLLYAFERKVGVRALQAHDSHLPAAIIER